MKNRLKYFLNRILPLTFAAAFFGTGYWLFLKLVQPLLINRIYNCDFCERCANILFNKEQPILAVCAGLAFFAITFLNVRGLIGALKTIGGVIFVFKFILN